MYIDEHKYIEQDSKKDTNDTVICVLCGSMVNKWRLETHSNFHEALREIQFRLAPKEDFNEG